MKEQQENGRLSENGEEETCLLQMEEDCWDIRIPAHLVNDGQDEATTS
ncbi:hypothetical protein [Laceyella putida]|jgi:hypothetical protein|uniref:Uncharacterized protein n=1 Tax=Laceyella putida TaxID=110101 RepID=A0ABW2RML6_9BACL